MQLAGKLQKESGNSTYSAFVIITIDGEKARQIFRTNLKKTELYFMSDNFSAIKVHQVNFKKINLPEFKFR